MSTTFRKYEWPLCLLLPMFELWSILLRLFDFTSVRALLLSHVSLHPATAINLKEYGLAKNIRRLSKKRRSLFFLILYYCSTVACFLALQKMTEVKRHFSMLQRRTEHVSSYNFNLNIYSDLHALRDFRFCVNEIGKVTNLMHCKIYSTRGDRYSTNPILSCATVCKGKKATRETFF